MVLICDSRSCARYAGIKTSIAIEGEVVRVAVGMDPSAMDSRLAVSRVSISQRIPGLKRRDCRFRVKNGMFWVNRSIVVT